MQFLPALQRVRCGALMAVTGGAVAQAMTLWGGTLAGYLPPMPALTGAATVGAGLAGVLLADAFGRRGRAGAICATLAWPMATGLGAVIGAAMFAVEWARAPIGMVSHALSQGGPLGVMAVADGITTSFAVASVWLLSGVAMHLGTHAERSTLT